VLTPANLGKIVARTRGSITLAGSAGRQENCGKRKASREPTGAPWSAGQPPAPAARWRLNSAVRRRGCVMVFFRKLFQRFFGRSGPRGSPSGQFMHSEEAKRLGYDATPVGLQWSPGPRRPVEKSKWKPCHACGRLIPVETERADTWTYVCPFCGHGHVGTPRDHPDVRAQARCHECGTDLDAAAQCPKCSFPRGWMTVQCPYCSNRQPVYAPHWVVHCDMFTLECVKCESTFASLCIC
jgi:hypothetical protein